MAMQKASTEERDHSMDSATDKTARESPPAARQREQQLQQRASAPHPRQRVSKTSNACEACRSAKVKCQPSSQLGICRRCHDSKRECVFKTGPRTRRPRQTKRTNPESASTSGQPQQAGAAAASLDSAGSAPNPIPSSSTPLAGSNSASGPAPLSGLGSGLNLGSGSGPSKTFTIDIPLPSFNDVADAFEELRIQHGAAIDGLGPAMDSSDENEADFGFDYPEGEPPADGDADGLAGSMVDEGSGSVVSSHTSSLPLGASAFSTPPSLSLGSTCEARTGAPKVQKRTMASAQWGLKPQFNVESAAALLKTFQETMLHTFPCLVLKPDASVADMARNKPFVLLAALAAASSSRTLQGHSLYDEEFRKILGLKFVAGGERSAELLEGLIVYTAWYPFHLRPKNKQAFQYVRMAVDIVNDLEIDQDWSDLHMGISPERRTLVRLYLAIYFMSSHYATAWNRASSLPYTAFTAQAIQLFLSGSDTGDVVLAWKARLQRLTEETHELRRLRAGDATTTYQIDLMVKGIESQLNEWANNMAPAIAAHPSVRISLLFCRIFILGAPLLKIPAPRTPKVGDSAFRVSAARLLSVLPSLHALFDYFCDMTPATINAICCSDWGSLILGIVLGYRMSFPLPECPEWDANITRHEVRFTEYLDRLCEMGGNGAGEDIAARLTPGQGGTALAPMDILSASKVVMEMLRRKYRKRLAKLTQPKNHPPQQQQQQQDQQGMMAALWAAATGSFTQQPVLPTTAVPTSAMPAATISGCPMLNGSVESFLPYWDETFSVSHLGQGIPAPLDMSQSQAQQLGLAEYPDLWATISTSWAQEDGTGFTAM